MHVVFDDAQFDFQTLRLLGSAASGDAEAGEVLSTAYRIQEGDFESWTAEWLKTAQRVHEIAEQSWERGHTVSAREAYFRASNYYRAAEFYLHGDPSDPRIINFSRRARTCFEHALDLTPLAVEGVAIPYEGTTLPGYFYRAGEAGAKSPTLLVHTGYDGTQEELRAYAMAATSRGINCLTFEGPGQGAVIREQGLGFRPDWEAVVTPVVDYVLGLPTVDPVRIALLGISFGGYLAPRAAAFEHRLAACIANGGVFDFMANRLPSGMSRQAAIDGVRNDPGGTNEMMRALMEASTDTRWGIENGIFTFRASSPADYYLKALDYTLAGIAEKITCPTLVIDSEGDQWYQGQARQLFDALTCDKTFLLFTAEDGAEDHCQVGSPLLSAQRIFDWLEETLGRVPSASAA
ncbi:MAG: alpha/beta hydrolase family protein [Acidimicrobiales bacterium]